MKNKKRYNGNASLSPIKLIITGIINITFVFMIILSLDVSDNEDILAHANSEMRVEVDPGGFGGLEITSLEDALAEANSQLQAMSLGDIRTINPSDIGYYGRFIRDYEMGDILYWELGDSTTDVYINARTSELIYYYSGIWADGTMSESQIEQRAIDIANQFSSFPDQYDGPTTTFFPTSVRRILNHTTDEIYDYSDSQWMLEYDRIKDEIIAEDNIDIWVNPDGSLYYYYKEWNMDLDEFSTTYTVSQEDAESTALAMTGQGSSINSSRKTIVRPNSFWIGDEFTFGLNPSCIWEIVVDHEGNTYIYQIDGNTNEIIGGDYIQYDLYTP
ncbi:MAG: hypothetical protein ACXADH_04505 [Candidatus Kariarchaeaceae archaeon]|jgi:hypothetical protein